MTKSTLINLCAETTGILLVGGKGRRMGYTDKSKLTFKNRTFMDIGLEALSLFNSNLISTKTYSKAIYPLPVVYDLMDVGPLGAIYSAMQTVTTPYIFVLSCDTPYMDTSLVEYILQNSDLDSLASLPLVNRMVEPLCGLYSTELAKVFKSSIDQSMYGVRQALSNSKIHTIDLKGSPHENKFFNVNYPEDYRML